MQHREFFLVFFGEVGMVPEPFQPGSEGKRGNSLKKIATFKPINLKSLSSGIQRSATKRKLTAAIRSAEQKPVTDKVQAVREQNPFSNIVEKQKGRSLNIRA